MWRTDIENAPKDEYLFLKFRGPFTDTESPGLAVGKMTKRGEWWTTSIWGGSTARGAPSHWMLPPNA